MNAFLNKSILQMQEQMLKKQNLMQICASFANNKHNKLVNREWLHQNQYYKRHKRGYHFQRLKQLLPDAQFQYHVTNSCYKGYTHKNFVKKTKCIHSQRKIYLVYHPVLHVIMVKPLFYIQVSISDLRVCSIIINASYVPLNYIKETSKKVGRINSSRE